MGKIDKIIIYMGNILSVVGTTIIFFSILLFIASSCNIGDVREKLNEIPTPVESREK